MSLSFHRYNLFCAMGKMENFPCIDFNNRRYLKKVFGADLQALIYNDPGAIASVVSSLNGYITYLYGSLRNMILIVCIIETINGRAAMAGASNFGKSHEMWRELSS